MLSPPCLWFPCRWSVWAAVLRSGVWGRVLSPGRPPPQLTPRTNQAAPPGTGTWPHTERTMITHGTDNGLTHGTDNGHTHGTNNGTWPHIERTTVVDNGHKETGKHFLTPTTTKKKKRNASINYTVTYIVQLNLVMSKLSGPRKIHRHRNGSR